MPPLLSNVCEDCKISMGLSFFPSKIIDELGERSHLWQLILGSVGKHF